MPDQRTPPVAVEAYSGTARSFHWLTLAFIVVLVPIGLVMADRAERNVFDATTNFLFSTHKLLGFTLLWVVMARLGYRLLHGAPADEPTLQGWERLVSHATHWAIYGLLVAVPLLGWIGISRLPALELFGKFNLPALVAASRPDADKAFLAHKLAAFALIGLVGLHIAAALFHYVVRKDGVLGRMLPGAERRG